MDMHIDYQSHVKLRGAIRSLVIYPAFFVPIRSAEFVWRSCYGCFGDIYLSWTRLCTSKIEPIRGDSDYASDSCD